VYKIHKTSESTYYSDDALNEVLNGVTHPSDVVVYHSLQQPRG